MTTPPSHPTDDARRLDIECLRRELERAAFWQRERSAFLGYLDDRAAVWARERHAPMAAHTRSLATHFRIASDQSPRPR